MADERTLLRNGSRVELTGREFDTLYTLVRQLGVPVPADDLRAEVWKDVNVHPNNVSQQIAAVRKVLGTNDNGEPYIRTISGHGYCVAGVSCYRIPLGLRPSGWRALAGLAAAIATIAALAFWVFGPRQLHLLTARQLTWDGREKLGPLVTDGSRIWFQEKVDGRSVIASVPIRGGDVTALQLPLDNLQLLSISPHHEALLVGTSQRLFEWRIREESLREIPIPSGTLPSNATWHPSSGRITLLTGDRLVLISPFATFTSFFFNFPGYVNAAQWDPDGNRLRVSVLNTVADTTTWWEMSGMKAEFHPLSPLSSSAQETQGVWTSDGRFFVFVGRTPMGAELWASDGRTGHAPHPIQLTGDARRWSWPLTATGRQTIFAIGMQAQGELVSVTGVKPPLAGVPAFQLDFSRDRRWVAYVRFPDHTIWRAKDDGSEPRQISPSGIEAHQPHWSPDGTRIAFMGKGSDRNSRWRIYLVPSVGGNAYEPLPDGDDQGVPTWSPDGTRLYFGQRLASSDFDTAAIRQLDLQSGLVSIIDAPEGMWSPRMSPDGRYLASVSHNSRSLYVRDNQSGVWTRRARMIFIEEPIWSADASWLQFTGQSSENVRATLYRIPPVEGEVRQILDPTSFDAGAWYGIEPNGSVLRFRISASEIYAWDWRPCFAWP